MKKKVISYLILLLLLPIVMSIAIALTNGSKSYDMKSGNDELLDIPDLSSNNINNNPYIYFGVITLVIGSVCVWWYIKKKEDF